MPGLDSVSIVLVEPRNPANIGAVARGMMNMGLSRLVLVNPPEDRQDQARKLAAGADRILNSAQIYSSLKEAVADQELVLGTSRHTGRLRKNIRTPKEIAEQVACLLEKNKVSLVFGNEVNGLSRSDLALCDDFISIPSSDEFPSLNLSHAVIIVAYELLIASRRSRSSVDVQLARKDELEDFYAHLQSTAQDIGFLDRNQPDRMMFILRQIFGRAKLDSREVRILRGILSRIDSVNREKK